MIDALGDFGALLDQPRLDPRDGSGQLRRPVPLKVHGASSPLDSRSGHAAHGGLE